MFFSVKTSDKVTFLAVEILIELLCLRLDDCQVILHAVSRLEVIEVILRSVDISLTAIVYCVIVVNVIAQKID